MEFLIGMLVGAVIATAACLFDCHRHKVKRRVSLEYEYLKLRGHVEQASAAIEEIINGSK